MNSLPKTIYIIRHCDKNIVLGDTSDEVIDDDDGKLTSDKADNGCSNDGYKRALLLAGLNGSCSISNICNNQCTGTFDPSNPGFFPKLLGPDIKPILLAPLSKLDPASKKTDTNCTSSNRCCLILDPLAYYYKTQINPNNESFCSTEPKEVGKMLINNPQLYGGQTIILAYEHKAIPDLLNTMKVDPHLNQWPKNADDRYDLVFKVTFDENPKVEIFSQKLLPQDTDDNPFEEKFTMTTKKPKRKITNLWLTLSLIFFSILVIVLIVLIMLLIK